MTLICPKCALPSIFSFDSNARDRAKASSGTAFTMTPHLASSPPHKHPGVAIAVVKRGRGVVRVAQLEVARKICTGRMARSVSRETFV